MGMSAAQAKLLSLTARRSDINYQLSSLMRGKLDLMTQASNAADMLADSKRNNNIFVLTTSDNQQTELSFNSLSKEGLTIVDAKGRTIVPSSYKTNPKGLTSILPASHPSVKSYDGDFVVKDKLNKNYVSIPQNQIPIFDNSKDFQQKYVKKFETVKTDNLTQITDYNSVLALTSQFNLNSGMGNDNRNISSFATNIKNSGFTGVIANNEGKFLDNYSTYATGTTELSTNVTKLEEQMKAAFKTEFGISSDKYNEYVSETNRTLGASYTAYYNRKFQSNLSWELSKGTIQTKKGNDIQYVSNAEQLITALLKDANVHNGYIESNANIMLLNDIDLDDMLQDDKNGKKGLKEFIQNEILSVSGLDEQTKQGFNELTSDTLSQDKFIWNKQYDGSSSSKIVNQLYQALNKENAKSTSGIKGDVLMKIWNKYFSDDNSADKFNEDFTNFIQIDKFTGAIGGGGFAINNLKMVTKNNNFAGMFGTLDGAVLDGIWMDNANVWATGNKASETSAAILANKVIGDTYISNISATGRQVYSGCQTFLGKIGDALKGETEANWGLVVYDERTRGQIKDGGGVLQDNITTNTGFLGLAHATDYYTTGWTYNSLSDNSYGARADAVSTGGDYYNASCNSAQGYNTDGKNRPYGHQVHISSTRNNNTKTSHGYAGKDVRKSKYNNSLNNGSIGYTEKGKTYDGTSVLGVLIQNSILDNSKIKFFQKNEGVEKYVEGSSNEISDWDADIDWDEWEYVDGNVNDDGTVALVKKHGEETEEYLSIMSLLEFYKEQGVNIDINEDRESGFLTYSAYGYSVDVEYKDDLEKYNSDPYLYKVENNDSSLLIYERDKVNDVDISQLVFVDDIEALLDKNIKNGVWFIQGASVSDAAKFERKSLDEIGISETTDENADNIAQAEYERKMRDIELQEEKFDAQITELENTLKGIEQEIENQQKIVKQNIQSSFSTFAS